MREVAVPRLADLTTLRLGGRAIAGLMPASPEELANVPARARELGGEMICIGRGSNLLAWDGELPIVLVDMCLANEIEIIEETRETIKLRAGAGVPLARLLNFCIKNGLSGMEGLAGVPGSVGGAVAMNAGSFGTEMASCLDEIQTCADGVIKCFKSSELTPAYRDMKFGVCEKKPMIWSAIFVLTRALKSVISKRIFLNFVKKKSRQPLGAWSAGCAFKNPDNNISAGKLLELAGFRGKKYGGMIFSPKHANFLVNEGRGSATAAMDFMNEAMEAVEKGFNVKLEPEIRIVPWPLP